jgi:hypothetical protein
VCAGPGNQLDQGIRPGPVHLDAEATLAEVLARYAVRWSIEPSNATGKQQMGVGQARNRLSKAGSRPCRSGC